MTIHHAYRFVNANSILHFCQTISQSKDNKCMRRFNLKAIVIWFLFLLRVMWDLYFVYSNDKWYGDDKQCFIVKRKKVAFLHLKWKDDMKKSKNEEKKSHQLLFEWWTTLFIRWAILYLCVYAQHNTQMNRISRLHSQPVLFPLFISDKNLRTIFFILLCLRTFFCIDTLHTRWYDDDDENAVLHLHSVHNPYSYLLGMRMGMSTKQF